MIKGLYLHHINQLLWGVDLKVGGLFHAPSSDQLLGV